MGSRHAGRLWRLAAGCAAPLALALLATGALRADILTTTDGKVYEGKIVERKADGVTFEVMAGGIRGRIFFAKERIAKLEEGLSPDERRQKAYEDRKKSLDLETAEGWHQLGLWCTDQAMYEEAAAAFKEARRQDGAFALKSTVAEARMETKRDRPRAARDLLEALLKDHPGDAQALAELALVRQRITAEVRQAFDGGRTAFRRGEFAVALGTFRRVLDEADAALLADLARDLEQAGEPAIAEMMVRCRLSDALIDKPATFETVTALEKPLLVERLSALVETGAKAAETAVGTIAAKTGPDVGQREALARRELGGLDRLDALAQVGRRLAGDLKNDQAVALFQASARSLAASRAAIALLWVEGIELTAQDALKTLTDDTVPFSKRAEAAETIAQRVQEGLAALAKISTQAADLSTDLAGRLVRQRRQFEELDRRVRRERDHLKTLETALDRGVRAYALRQWLDVVREFTRLVEAASGRELAALEDLVYRRTGKDLDDLLVEGRVQVARQERRFRVVTPYEQGPLDRELADRALRTLMAAADALRTAKSAPPGSAERTRAARQTIDLAQEAVFYLEGRRQIGAPLSWRERDRIAGDLAEAERLTREARTLLSA